MLAPTNIWVVRARVWKSSAEETRRWIGGAVCRYHFAGKQWLIKELEVLLKNWITPCWFTVDVVKLQAFYTWLYSHGNFFTEKKCHSWIAAAFKQKLHSNKNRRDLVDGNIKASISDWANTICVKNTNRTADGLHLAEIAVKVVKRRCFCC